jgi:hypothetical protein
MFVDLEENGVMLLVVTGSSCAGKSTLAFPAGDRFVDLVVHDFDEVGVPVGADRRWRQQTLEAWVMRAVKYQATGRDVLLTGQSPLGEVLAVPSALLLDGLAVCLLDVSDEVRRRRLEERDPGKWRRQDQEDFIGWARWHRLHAADPQYRPDVITADAWEEMVWRRWSTWRKGDPRWVTEVLDTTGQTVAASTVALAGWIERARHFRGGLGGL